jgi:hypothetical protein
MLVADGEVVWSRRPDAGVKSSGGMSARPGGLRHIRLMTVANKPGHRGEREVSR